MVVGGTLQSIAGVLASQPTECATIPVDNSEAEERFTGFAVANISDGDINITVFTLNEDGAILDQISPPELNPLGPQKQVARFLHQEGYLPSRTNFKGLMVLASCFGGRKVRRSRPYSEPGNVHSHSGDSGQSPTNPELTSLFSPLFTSVEQKGESAAVGGQTSEQLLTEAVGVMSPLTDVSRIRNGPGIRIELWSTASILCGQWRHYGLIRFQTSKSHLPGESVRKGLGGRGASALRGSSHRWQTRRSTSNPGDHRSSGR